MHEYDILKRKVISNLRIWRKVSSLSLMILAATPFLAGATELVEGGITSSGAPPPSVVLSGPAKGENIVSSVRVATPLALDNRAPTVKPPKTASSNSSSGKQQSVTVEIMDINEVAESQTATDTKVWEILDSLTQSDMENSVVSLDTGGDDPVSAEVIEGIESLWNLGSFVDAINQIRILEEEGRDIAIGISWKTPKTVISAQWVTSDPNIGSRTEVYNTDLDFDAQNGNQFAVLSYRDGSNTYWYWSVNISYDNGATWLETFTYWALYNIRDISAAVVDDFLWVGHIGNTSFDEARMVRFNVSDGSRDAVYGYKTIFDKNRPIKDIALFTNADGYDNRVYYSAILEDYVNSLNEIIVPVLPESAASRVDQEAEIVTGTTDEMLSQLASHQKVSYSNEILTNFKLGETTTRVIVTLANTMGGECHFQCGEFKFCGHQRQKRSQTKG